MAYYFYLNKILLPVTPGKLNVKINGNNKSIMLINEGEINILKKAKLTEVSFDVLLPNVKYPFAVYKSGFQDAKYFLGEIEKLKKSQKPFQFIVTRELPSGKLLFDTNLKVALEDYQIKEDAKDGFDVTVTINLKQYKNYGTKTCKVNGDKVTKKQERPTENAPNEKNCTIKKGDTLWNIAKKLYGDGEKYKLIYEANKDKIKNPNLVREGQKLIIPR